MDRQSVFSLSVLPPEYGDNEDTRGQVQSQLEQFILQFRIDNAFIYRYETFTLLLLCNIMLINFIQRSNSRKCATETILLRRRCWAFDILQ